MDLLEDRLARIGVDGRGNLFHQLHLLRIFPETGIAGVEIGDRGRIDIGRQEAGEGVHLGSVGAGLDIVGHRRFHDLDIDPVFFELLGRGDRGQEMLLVLLGSDQPADRFTVIIRRRQILLHLFGIGRTEALGNTGRGIPE